MSQISLSAQSRSKPVLELCRADTGEVRRVSIESTPFTIGRADSCDLQINSVQISREHAQVVERSGAWLIRDLHSTNGTQVNGKVVGEALLSDGDILRIADTELTFVASSAAQFQRMVTQPMRNRQANVSAAQFPAELNAARVLAEATLWQAIPVELLSISSMGHGPREAQVARLPLSGTMLDYPRLFAMQHRAGQHFRNLFRIRAAELASTESEPIRLFVVIDPIEFPTPNAWDASLDRVFEMLPPNSEAGVNCALPSSFDLSHIALAYREFRSRRLLIAFDSFEGGGKQVLQLDKFVPEYLILAESMLKNLTTAPHAMRRLESVLAACEELAVRPVLPAELSDQTLALCRQLGYDLALHATSGYRKSLPELAQLAH